MNTSISSRPARLAALLVAAAIGITGCSSAAPAATPTQNAGEVITIGDPWVKAAASGMSAAFGELRNASDREVTVVSATTPVSTSVQLHETVDNGSGSMVMRQIQGGFVVPAHGSLTLKPGGNHIMLMGLTAPLTAGQDAAFTLTFSDGSTYTFTAPVKDYSGANENYVGGDSKMDMGGSSGGTNK